MAEEEDCVLQLPVLLAPPPSSVKKYQSLIEADYNYPPSRRGNVFDLQNAVLDAVSNLASTLEIPSDGLEVAVYELNRPRPSTDGTTENMDDAYGFINKDYLKKKAVLLGPRRLLKGVKLENVIAALTIVRPVPSTPSLATVYEENAQIRREEIAAAARQRDSPSAGASLTQRILIQKSIRPDAVYNHRPADLTPPPITLYHPVFAKFLQLMEKPQEPTHEELEQAQIFIIAASDYYRDEAERVVRLSSIMKTGVHNDILGMRTLSYVSSQFTSDGVVFSREAPGGFSTIVAIIEVKSEIGEGGSDPIAQAECAYVAAYSSDEARHIRGACCCPALIIGIPGPNIIVGGAVFADKIITQTLTDYISVIPRPNQKWRSPLDDAAYRVAHLFRALKECISDLDTYYSQLVLKISPPPPLPAAGVTGGRDHVRTSAGTACTPPPPPIIGPHFTTYNSEGKKVVLTYQARLLSSISMKAVFVAEAKSESETVKVVVKFAHTYNEDAHELLANLKPSQAPKLRYCKFELTVGMWAVVMDYVEGPGADGILTGTDLTESLRVALKKLHSGGFVFGDLRSPNVLVVGKKVMLIDFDWCGKVGTARYPSDIMLTDGMWHPEVQRGGLIEQAHDEYHFRKLTGEEL